MPRFKVEIIPAAQAELDALPAKIQRQLTERIFALAGDPTPQSSKRLEGDAFKGLRRIRSGDYRIIYHVNHGRVVVVVIAISDRKDAYTKLARRMGS